ncbi:TRAP-type C4-dicarboxylate transport system, small permease component [Prauserella aidingensis]|uniref:TRAP transporter small permease n=1 Tax=Prauserella aidingensis TaxID=387890 RepID=UPI0020A58DED|nr:TRAP transporter small permease subunit [Prauserella aidingensis]MCP2252766.1 TRAP-type C4-dicarboxylate transport system, small permease component [Prauserella aidingensis]
MAEQDGTAARSRPAPLRWLSTVESAVGGLLLATILVLMLGQALQRYLPTGGWVGSGELARFSLVWLTFAMAGYLMERDGHVTLKVIDTVTRGLTRRLVFLFANIMVAIVCLNLAYEAFVLVTDDSSQVSPALGIPIRWFYVIPLVGFLLTALRSVVAVFLPPRAVGEESQA